MAPKVCAECECPELRFCVTPTVSNGATSETRLLMAAQDHREEFFLSKNAELCHSWCLLPPHERSCLESESEGRMMDVQWWVQSKNPGVSGVLWGRGNRDSQ